MNEPAIRNWESMPPSGGWRISIGIKGQTFNFTGSPHSIVSGIAGVQKRNNDYRGDEWIWNHCNSVWCARSPERCLEKGRITMSNTVSGKSKVLTYLAQLKSLVASGMKPVDIEKAEARAAICAACPFNMNVEKCGSCIATAKAITFGLLGKRNTIYDSKLNQCGVCGCELKAKIHYPLNEGDKNQYPENCWVTKEKP